MSEVVPSYILKLDRAETHLKEFKGFFTAYVKSHPHTVTDRREGKKQVHRLHFKNRIDVRAEMVAADLIYNVRSGLDHFAAALNPRGMRRKVMFPIHWQGVWEPAIEGEDCERAKARQRWNTSTREVHPDARALLQRLQPPEGGRNDAGDFHLLVALNRLSNQDRHYQLPVMPVGLADSRAKWQMPDGKWHSGADPRYWGMVQDGAELGLPDGAMNVKIDGTPKIALRASGPDLDVEVPLFFDNVINFVRTEVFERLYPFLATD